MSLTTLVRSIGVLAMFWTLAAIGIGASGLRIPAHASRIPAASEPPPVDAMPANWPRVDRYELVDRSSGRALPIRLPESGQWSLMRVSPWRGPDGELEAIGRWVASDTNAEEFCGWGLFRLSDGAVIGRTPTESLPSGRPCWVPGCERTFVYPAADGRLYRCRLDGARESSGSGEPRPHVADRPEGPEPVLWGILQPGAGHVLLDEPYWPDDPRLSRWIFATLRPQVRRDGKTVFGPGQLWWLELGEHGRVIVAAGRLAGTAGSRTAGPWGVEERHPTVVVAPDGAMRLAYLAGSARCGSWALRSGVIQLDPALKRPLSVTGDAAAPDAAGGLLDSPLLVSSDGSTVYVARNGGGRGAFRLIERSGS
jgi:hypothetical protein